MCLALIAAIVLFLVLPPLRARLLPPRKGKPAAETGKA
jgi:hypothetical protein